MPLSNREKLEIITRAKKDGYKGDYLELFRMAEQQMRQDMPEPQFRDGGFPGGINVQGFSNVQVPNPVPTDPALGVNVSGFNLSKDFNLGKNFNFNISNPGLVHSRASYYNKPVDTFGSLKIPFEPKIGLSYNFEGGGFSNDINKPGKSTYVDARSGYGFPTTYEHGGPHTEVTDFVTDFEAQNPGRYLPPSSLDSVQAITNVENFLEGTKKYDSLNTTQDFKDAFGIRGEVRRVPYYEGAEGIMSRTYNNERSNIEVVPNWYIDEEGGKRYVDIDDNPTTAFTKSDIKGVKKPNPEFQIMPTIPVKPIPTTPPSGPTKAIPYVTESTGPSKSDLFFQGLENAQVYYNRPDEFTRGRGEGDATVSTQYIFSPNNPFIPKKGQYFTSEPNTRGKRKTYGDLDKAREWEREQGLGTQSDLEGYNVGNTFKHGGFAAFFASDYDKYVQKKENGGEGEPLVLNPDYKEFNPMLSERQRYRNFLMREEAGKEYMKTIDSAIKKPDGSYYKAFENGLYYPYIIEGEDEATIGYGRKKANVLKDYASGISEQQALNFMDEDIDNSLRLAKIYVEENENSPMYGDVGSFGRLDSATQYMLADYPYNVGRLSKFKNFAKAVLTNDPVGAEKEYKRVKDKSTNVPLKRNVGFYNEYVKPFIQSITD